MAHVDALRFHEARDCVIAKVLESDPAPAVELVSLTEAGGRVLAEDLVADRDYPALPRSVRDGFAVRRADLPGILEIIGEVRAGERFSGVVSPGQAVEIMTGAPVPEGADAIVMVEYANRDGARVSISAASEAGQFINPKGSEAQRGDRLLGAGRRLGFAEVALAAMVGASRLRVYRKPRVAILSTGDEIVPVDEIPLDFQVRNSNACSLAVQVAAAGGVPVILPVARDDADAARELILRGLHDDLLLISGGVSAGKYDVIELVLAGIGAQFFFDRVLIQPGQPIVFGRARDKFFFGLPGNPASTMVTFELFARAAVELLGGQAEVSLHFYEVPLAREFRHKAGLTRFVPARLSPDGREVAPLPWRGSSDVPTMARANALLVAQDDRESWRAGEPIGVIPL